MKKASKTRLETEPFARNLDNDPHLFRRLIDATGMAVSIHDKKLVPLYGNAAYTKLWGYPIEELQRTPMETVLPKKTLEIYRNEVEPAIAAGRHWQGEYGIRSKNGQLHNIRSRFDPIPDGSGEITHAISINQNAPDLERPRTDMEAARESLNFISNSSSDIFFRLKLPEGTYDYLSPSVERFSGYSLEEYDANPLLIRNIIHPDWQGYFQETFEELLRGEVRPEYEFQFIHKSGEPRWASQRVVLLKDNAGKTLGIEGIATDVTARKHAEELLRASEEKYRFLTENITDIIWTMDDDYKLTYATPSIVDILEYSFEELQDIPLTKILTPGSAKAMERAKEQRRKAEARGEFGLINQVEMEFLLKNGETLWVDTVIKRLFDAKGQPNGYQGVSRDITQRRETRIAMAKSEARFRTLFEDSPISLWEEDLSRLKTYFDELKAGGVTDFRQFFYDNPDRLAYCATLVTVVDVNKATLDLLGASSKEDLLGNLEKVLTDSSMAAFTEEMILLASGGCEYCGEITNRTLHGETIWVMVHFFVPDEFKDTLSRVIVSLLNVTPRKRAEQALMDSEERYRVLAENSQEGVVVQQDGKPIYINESMVEIVGYSLNELKEMHLPELVHPQDRESFNYQLAGLTAGEEKEAFASFRIITRHEQVRWVMLNVKPIMWEGREAKMAILTDVTHHKALEAELLTAHGQMEDRVKKRTTELSEANTQLKAEAEERSKAQERILSLTQEIIRVQEDERQRIARDLHDNVAQDLSSLMLRMETLFDGHSRVDLELHKRGITVMHVLRGAIASVRDIAYGLRPPALDQLGLVKALENLCTEAGSRHSFDVDFFSTGIQDIALDFDTEINIYRMVQEAVRNIARHARAKTATIRLVKSHPDILIRIEDNGQGFLVQERLTTSDSEKRMGLRSMEERARLIGGSMEIQSLPGTGTRIIFKVPIDSARRQG
ncbi:PAS domain S-box protein [Pseudodesulfovibrio sp. S3]|uniref:sensor histidine kinase n=1 Tax=unclassified Pseudodesulfovibrio TaxID=2661612 RepID=UPI001F4FC2A5|nr:PAS domain S-box protein [Pseudodesulfovibrio sp. S3]MCJ2165198.1 PAS domain S-box protein [Pseudodesulfovibrio sp. S3-i]